MMNQPPTHNGVPWINATPAIKRMRSVNIAEYLQYTQYSGAVLFGDDYDAAALADAGVDTLHIRIGGKPVDEGDLIAATLWPAEQIQRIWPVRFDATAGHLPWHLIARVVDDLLREMPALAQPHYCVAAISGETAVVLATAYPDTRFTAVYQQTEAAAPLLSLVRRLCAVEGIED